MKCSGVFATPDLTAVQLRVRLTCQGTGTPRPSEPEPATQVTVGPPVPPGQVPAALAVVRYLHLFTRGNTRSPGPGLTCGPDGSESESAAFSQDASAQAVGASVGSFESLALFTLVLMGSGALQ